MDAEREAYAELAQIAAQWQRLAEWARERRVRADRAVRRAIARPTQVNGRPLELTSGSRSPASGSRSLTDTWPGVPMPPASNDEPIPLVRVKTGRRPAGNVSAQALSAATVLEEHDLHERTRRLHRRSQPRSGRP